ncbi:MAG: YHS domain-containing protein [Candidatus Bathyarchaeia archaeon]
MVQVSIRFTFIVIISVNERAAKFKLNYTGKTYYFCSKQCKETFDKNPAKYAGR